MQYKKKSEETIALEVCYDITGSPESWFDTKNRDFLAKYAMPKERN